MVLIGLSSFRSLLADQLDLVVDVDVLTDEDDLAARAADRQLSDRLEARIPGRAEVDTNVSSLASFCRKEPPPYASPGNAQWSAKFAAD